VWHMAQAGYHTAVVERRLIGGSCPNITCLPSTNEIWSVKVSELVRRAAEFGTVTGPRGVDMARVRQRKRDMVNNLITFVPMSRPLPCGRLDNGDALLSRRV